MTPFPRSRRDARAIHAGLMQTAAKWNSAASSHSRSMSQGEASGLSSVWSMYSANPAGTSAPDPQ